MLLMAGGSWLNCYVRLHFSADKSLQAGWDVMNGGILCLSDLQIGHFQANW